MFPVAACQLLVLSASNLLFLFGHCILGARCRARCLCGASGWVGALMVIRYIELEEKVVALKKVIFRDKVYNL